MPMRAFIPIAAQSLSLPLHVKHRHFKEGSVSLPHQGLSHLYETSNNMIPGKGKAKCTFCDNKRNLSVIAALWFRASAHVGFFFGPSGAF